jgi:hypothetical protein
VTRPDLSIKILRNYSINTVSTIIFLVLLQTTSLQTFSYSVKLSVFPVEGTTLRHKYKNDTSMQQDAEIYYNILKYVSFSCPPLLHCSQLHYLLVTCTASTELTSLIPFHFCISTRYCQTPDIGSLSDQDVCLQQNFYSGEVILILPAGWLSLGAYAQWTIRERSRSRSGW